MRRVILWLLGSAVGTTLLVGVKTAPGTLPFGSSASAPRDQAADPGATPAPAGSVPPASLRASAAPAGAATPRPPIQPRTTPPAATRRTILGNPYPAKDYGDVQVKVVLTGTHIDDIVVVQMSDRPRNAPARLRAEALAEQSADNLTNVSGATYTCDAYVRSLRSALAKA